MSTQDKLAQALHDLVEAYCRAGAPLTREERREDRMRLIAAREALAAHEAEAQAAPQPEAVRAGRVTDEMHRAAMVYLAKQRCPMLSATVQGALQAALAAQQAEREPLTDEQRLDWLCEVAELTCGQWQIVIESDAESFIDAVDELAARAHGIGKEAPNA